MNIEWLYHATCERVVDGDSIILTIDAGFDVLLNKQSVRLYGIDTAETRGGTPELKALGNLAKDYVKQMVPEGSSLLIRTHMDRKGKFGRILAEVYLPEVPDIEGFQDRSLNNILLDEMLAVQYHGQSKEDIVNQHLINVQHHKTEGRI
jgi:endonuclease YncB( thermonuclease family)